MNSCYGYVWFLSKTIYALIEIYIIFIEAPGNIPGALILSKRRSKMFNDQKFLTRGVMAEIPSWLTNLMWHMVLTMEAEEKDYLQVFTLTKTPTGQHIVHEQEQPPYRYELDVPCDDAVNIKVFVIDDLTHSTMLLAEEY